MIVMKFGGSSVGDAERIRTVAEVVRSRLDRNPVVVCSAHKGVTNMLEQLSKDALQGEFDLTPVREAHEKIIADLGLEAGLVDAFLEELSFLLKGVSLVRELTPRTSDYVMSFGERLSTRVIAAYFNTIDMKAAAVDAFDAGMITDMEFCQAQPLPEADDALKSFFTSIDYLPIVTGFIGKNKDGDITTLGRNGSDYTASIIGAALDVEEIQIWTDVDGVMTADPREVEAATPVEQMTFDEASELAYYGGRVLHPATLVPAVRKEIPVRVLNTFCPESPGSVIVADEDPDHHGRVKCVASLGHQIIVNITSSRMFLRHGFMAKVFEIFGRHRIVVNMIATSEVSVSVTVHSDKGLDAAAEELSAFAEVTIERNRSIICVVGQGLRSTPGIASDVFSAVTGIGVNVLMISQGASSINLAFVVTDEDAPKVIKALHAKYFE